MKNHRINFPIRNVDTFLHVGDSVRLTNSKNLELKVQINLKKMIKIITGAYVFILETRLHKTKPNSILNFFKKAI